MGRVVFEFYRPFVSPENNISFLQIMRNLAAMPIRDRIWGPFQPMGIFSLQEDGGQFLGEAAKIRMHDLPRIIDVVEGTRRDIDLLDHQGLGEEIHFLYDHTVDTIAVQKKGQFRASGLRTLIEGITRCGIEFQIILTRDALQRFQRMPQVRKISFKLARPQHIAGPMAVTRVLDELAEFDGVSAKVEISVSRQRNRSLNLERVWDVIRGYQNRRDDFESLSVKGPVEDPELGPHLETIDFVAEHLKQIDEDVTETDRGLNPESCRMALRRSLRIHRDYLREYRE